MPQATQNDQFATPCHQKCFAQILARHKCTPGACRICRLLQNDADNEESLTNAAEKGFAYCLASLIDAGVDEGRQAVREALLGGVRQALLVVGVVLQQPADAARARRALVPREDLREALLVAGRGELIVLRRLRHFFKRMATSAPNSSSTNGFSMRKAASRVAHLTDFGDNNPCQ